MQRPKSNSVISNKDESVPLFDNAYLETISHIHPILPAIVYGPVLTYFGWTGFQQNNWWQTLLAICAGLLIWSLTEYFFHRVIFHHEVKSSLGKRIHFLAHGVHHAYPQDRTRLLLPPALSLPAIFAFYLLFLAAVPNLAAALFTGFVLGYLLYDYIHYATHHVNLPGPIGRRLKQNHLRHHYADEEKSFGVTSPLWDYVFGTRS